MRPPDALPGEMPQLPRPRRRRHDHVDPALLAALTAPASPVELVGEEQSLAMFRNSLPLLPARPRWRHAALTGKLATVLAVGALGLSGAGVATAAYTGSLPDTLQDVAHKTIKAPAAHHAKAVGPDPTGEAAYGLCNAFDKVKEHGKAKQQSVAFENLATAAGGAGKVAAYCATITKPNESPEPRTHSTGKPSHPTGKPSAKPGLTHRP